MGDVQQQASGEISRQMSGSGSASAGAGTDQHTPALNACPEGNATAPASDTTRGRELFVTRACSGILQAVVELVRGVLFSRVVPGRVRRVGAVALGTANTARLR